MLTDNEKLSRFERLVDGELTYANYMRDDKNLTITHVFAPPVLRGTGAAGALMQAIVDQAQKENRNIIPTCSYAAAWLARHRA